MQSVLHPIIGPAGPEVKDLKGRTALITGGANGIGKEVARAFAKYGAKVIMINRKEEQGSAAIEQFNKEAQEQGIQGGQLDVHWVGCDIAKMSDVRKVFSEIAEKEDRLDLLVLSAGINSEQFGLSADNLDRHFALNALGHFYIVNLFYPLLRKTSKLPNTPPPRIVFESSEQHRFAPPNVHYGSLAEINDDTIDPNRLYGRTKLALILYTKGLLEYVIKKNNDNIYVLAVHPGTVNTNMQEQWKKAYPGLFGQTVSFLMQTFGRDIEQGSYSALYAALADEVLEKGWNGYYFSDPAQPGKETAQANDKWLIRSCWELSERLIREKAGEDALKPWDA
ncbi:putative short-chain dehydrogenase TIC 32, chloroplastic [Heliocybe sulcata]|uniref:Putative short-chain dehydrogenase TIC 32, chloroplastic n=1 Tax=Heliocybe sulcata TaxID=5364 RepID=A0A5C3MT33_9AGAM|nr:putative short-chain dehydrogenase TIC 32, chloroplastic [Heliocybe sulcata]